LQRQPGLYDVTAWKSLILINAFSKWVIRLSLKSKSGVFILALVFLTAMGMAIEEMGKYSINLSTNDTLGTFLVNETGFTLYYFMNDAPGNGISNCSGKCAEIWPPFYAEILTVPDGLNADDFASQLRGDGKEQTAYKGWPLYFYYKDIEPKDAYGQGLNKIWFVVNPSSSQFNQSGPSGGSTP
jgi:predicted lipoprotein with Yx(FWY)xxD motif